jgi:hypothetical protein
MAYEMMKSFDICSNIYQKNEKESISEETCSNSGIHLTPKKSHKEQRKIKKHKKIQKRGHLSLQRLPHRTYNSQKINQFKEKDAVEKKKNFKSITFKNKRKLMSFSFYQYEEDKIQVGTKFTRLHNSVEDYDVDTDCEILENALWTNFQILRNAFL